MNVELSPNPNQRMFEDEVQVPEYVGPRCKCFSVFKDIPGVPIKRLPQPQLACCCLICHTPHTLIIHPSFRDFYAFQLVSKIIGSCIYSFGKKSVVFLVSRYENLVSVLATSKLWEAKGCLAESQPTFSLRSGGERSVSQNLV